MDMIKLDYYYGQQGEQFAFFRIPKLLFTNPFYKDISAEAKILYGFMLDRMALSQKNGWLDDENRVYIIFTVEDVEDQFGCCHDKAVKLLAELDGKKGVGLIERVRRGLGQPSIIYVKNFASIEAAQNPEKPCSNKKSENQTSRSRKIRLQEVGKTDFKKSEKQTSGGLQNRLQEVGKSDANNTNINNTNLSKLKSIYPSIDGRMDGAEEDDPVESLRENVKTQIEYDVLAEAENVGMIDEIVGIMVKVLSSTSPTIKISGEDVKTELVMDAYRRLRSGDIEGVINAFRAIEEPILNPTNYIRSMLYHAPDSGFLVAVNQVSSRYSKS